jgi:Kef-type K+ transport system membrane component KefB
VTNTDLLLRLLLQIATVLVICRAVGWIGRRVGQTQVVCDMLAGILLGPSLFGAVWPSAQQALFPRYAAGSPPPATHPSMVVLYVLSQLGLVLYMFLVGLDFKIDLIRGRVRTIGLVSIAGIVVPFVLGATAALVLVRQPGLFDPRVANWHAAFFLGAAMSITAFPVLARILEEKHIASTPLGTLTLAAGSFDDVVAWCLLAVLLATLNATAAAVLAVGGAVVFAAAMLLIARPLFRRFENGLRRDGTLAAPAFVSALVVAMMSAVATEWIGIHAVFGAFIAGIAMPRGRVAASLRDRLDAVTTTVLLPLFFVYSGLNTEIRLLDSPRLWAVAGAIVVLAVAGKGLACAAAARLAGEGWREAAAIGTLMNARGLVELIMLNIGLQTGIIQPALFTILVLMAVLTTVMTSPLFEQVYGRHLDRAGTLRFRAARA